MEIYRPGLKPVKPKSTAKQAKQQKKKLPKSRLVFIALVIVVIVIGLILSLNRPTKSITSNTANNTYDVIDDPSGLKFSISKSFNPISPSDLNKLSPLFVYGYEIPDVSTVRCIISQTARSNSSMVSQATLAQGTYSQLKQSYTNVQPVGYKAITLKDKTAAAEVVVTYTDGSNQLKQVEVAAATTTKTTFAFCATPASLYNYYEPSFTSFFNSLEIY